MDQVCEVAAYQRCDFCHIAAVRQVTQGTRQIRIKHNTNMLVLVLDILKDSILTQRNTSKVKVWLVLLIRAKVVGAGRSEGQSRHHRSS